MAMKQDHPLYRTWNGMLQRCENSNDKGYKDYGGRGIKVCARWHEFDNFAADMGIRPKGLTLDRLNNDKGYNPSNCRWATPKQQSQNMRRNHMVRFKGLSLSISEWAERLGIKRKTLQSRIQGYKWSVKRAFTTPVVRRNRRYP